MDPFNIQPIAGSSTTEVANLLLRWRAEQEGEASLPSTIGQDRNDIERRLHWLLIENPLAPSAPHYGFCLRNASREMAGLLLCFPYAFVAEDRRLRGLCLSSFYVEPSARGQGRFLFERYLGDPLYDLFFGMTFNERSGAMFRKSGGSAVPNSDMQYILPLNLEVMLPMFLAGRTSSRIAAKFAQSLGQFVTSVLKPGREWRQKFSFEPCRDWQKLSELFHRHRPQRWITTDRSPEFLQWRYGPGSPHHSAEICLFRDQQGNEGWFVVAETTRGRHGEIRGALLLDAVWPRDRIHFRQVLPAILGCKTVSHADAVIFQPRPGVDYRECSRWIIPRRLPLPQVFAAAYKDAEPLDVSLLDLVPADGDSSFRTTSMRT